MNTSKELTKEFINEVTKEIESIIGDNGTVQCTEVIKNNNVRLNGITILLPGENVSPTAYIENFTKEDSSARDVAKEIISTIAEARYQAPHIDTSEMTDFEKAKDKICYRLINKKNNEELLKTIPYTDFLDLAVILVLDIGELNGGRMSAKINNEILRNWNKSFDEVYEFAKENTKNIFIAKITDMFEVMAEMAGIPIETFEMLYGNTDIPKQYVLTNDSTMNGATCLLYENVLKELSDMVGGDFVILPSSVHEVIIQPITEGITLDDLSRMVTEVNEAEVPAEDILSDHAYVYRRETGKIEY